MARMAYLSKSDLKPEDQDILARDINIVRLLAHSPNMARHLLETALYVRNKSPLDARLREMAIIQVGYAMHSAYEYTHHIELAHAFGVSDDDIRAIADESAGKPTTLGDLDRAVLRAAREISDDGHLNDQTFTTLRVAFDNRCLVDLIATIAVYTGTVRLIAALQIDLEDRYLPFLEKFPLGRRKISAQAGGVD